jgi:predicted NUDIX family NTP pyrophosphohydrolase
MAAPTPNLADWRSMPKTSAGILLFRRPAGGLQLLLAHPGGPFWAKKDEHAWSIPKGEFDPAVETPAQAALRELAEELGASVPGPMLPLSAVKQPGGKVVHAFAVEQDFDPAALVSNLFTLEWPPRSGRQQQFPEVDRVAWFSLEESRTKLLVGQLPLVDELERLLSGLDPGV